MRSSSLFSPMAAVRRPSPHRLLAAVLLSLLALTGKPGSSGREEGCREGEGRKAMGGSTVAAQRDMSEPWLQVGKRVKTEEASKKRKKDDIMVATVNVAMTPPTQCPRRRRLRRPAATSRPYPSVARIADSDCFPSLEANQDKSKGQQHEGQ
uniref:Uncharacterized protein n=1 Tax=Oryza glumipatula TaxID=40148 RepID=A0A0D9ZBD8_9ORYZ